VAGTRSGSGVGGSGAAPTGSPAIASDESTDCCNEKEEQQPLERRTSNSLRGVRSNEEELARGRSSNAVEQQGGPSAQEEKQRSRATRS
jgi:hypothetical protein